MQIQWDKWGPIEPNLFENNNMPDHQVDFNVQVTEIEIIYPKGRVLIGLNISASNDL